MSNGFAINEKGLEQVRMLREDLFRSVEEILQASQDLQKKTLALGDSLGTYGDPVLWFSRKTHTKVESFADEIGLLMQKLDQQAAQIEQFMHTSDPEKWVALDNSVHRQQGIRETDWKYFGVDCAHLLVQELEKVQEIGAQIRIEKIGADSITDKILHPQAISSPVSGPNADEVREMLYQEELSAMLGNEFAQLLGGRGDMGAQMASSEEEFAHFKAEEVMNLDALNHAGKRYAEKHGMVPECANARGYLDCKIGKTLFQNHSLWNDPKIQDYFVSAADLSGEERQDALSADAFSSMREMVGQCVSEFMNTKPRPEEWSRDQNEAGTCRYFPDLVARYVFQSCRTGNVDPGITEDPELRKLISDIADWI